jgi:hypothetical protein
MKRKKGVRGSAAGEPSRLERSSARRQLGRDIGSTDATPKDTVGPPAQPDIIRNKGKEVVMAHNQDAPALQPPRPDPVRKRLERFGSWQITGRTPDSAGQRRRGGSLA